MQEQVFFQEGEILVTQSRFVVPGRTIAMQGIDSVAYNVFTPKASCGVQLIGGVGVIASVILILVGFGIMSDAGFYALIPLALGGGIMAGLIYWWRSQDKRPDHQIVLNAVTTTSTSVTGGGGFLGGRGGGGLAVTGSSGQNFMVAFSSKDEDLIRRIIEALNNAIVSRG